MDTASLVAIDTHTHAEVSCWNPFDNYGEEYDRAADKYFGSNRRPTIAFGNSDGDFEMLEWTTTAPGPRLGLIVHHTDAEREWAYDRESSVGALARGLDEAAARGWVVMDMQRDWKAVFAFEQ